MTKKKPREWWLRLNDRYIPGGVDVVIPSDHEELMNYKMAFGREWVKVREVVPRRRRKAK